MPLLTDSVSLAGRSAPARVVFGPHPTNLGRGRAVSERHVAYYARRAEGGIGIIVTETASVTSDDWPYERAPLATECEPGWAATAEACRPYGTLVLAGLGHTGGQGSSAYSQSVMWAPSRFADAASRELPAEMEQPQIDEVIAGFAAAARVAARAGLDGVELDAGPFGLLRQFHSGLSNMRGDDYGTDRLRLTREVIAAVREGLGDERVLSLRLSCDELAPWAGVTPEQAADQVAALADSLDLLVVVRGGPFSTAAYRPTAHVPPAFNVELCRQMRDAADGRVPVVLQGSVVDLAQAQSALDDGVADLVEMTRASIAERALVRHLRDGSPERVRPCLLCNQACQVRDNRNPIVSCVGEPGSGHETKDLPTQGHDPDAREVLVVGAGPAGLEAARVLSGRGHPVRVADRAERAGGMLPVAANGPGRERLRLLTDWLEAECRRQDVQFDLGVEIDAAAVEQARAAGVEVLLATGSRAAERRYAPGIPGADVADAEGRPGPDAPSADDPTAVIDVVDLLRTPPQKLPAGPYLVHDPIGGPIAIGVAEWLAALGHSVALATPDQIAGTLLSLTGDLAPANTRLQQAGVRRELRVLVREVGGGRAVLEDVWTGERREVPATVVVDCGHRLPDDSLYSAVLDQTGEAPARAGDCVAPRTVLEAVLEGRRRALELGRRPALAVRR
jgi:mycofactocin system FadH/OYE family oxidoreductase 1